VLWLGLELKLAYFGNVTIMHSQSMSVILAINLSQMQASINLAEWRSVIF